MVTTRRSSHHEDNGAPASPDAATGSKHKLRDAAGGSPETKRGKKSDEKKQQTIEESIEDDTGKDDDSKEVDGKDTNDKDTNGKETHGKEANGSKNQNGHDDTKDSHADSKTSSNGHSAVDPHGRDGATPSSVLEKGIVYFFFRGRVGIDEPSDVAEIARSYILLRPISQDAALADGPIGDAGNTRICVVPKKKLPTSGRERWIAFVDSVGKSFAELKETFLASNDYETKTAGTRHSPAATPVAEGVYAITSTGRDSHLAYILTLPDKLGEVQTELGLREKGSFIISTRNPDYPAPQNARIGKDPEYSKEIKDEFRSLRWIGTRPEHLDVVNTQFLLVGESSGIEKATEPQKDQKEGENEPREELEQLEDEDAERMKHLSESDSQAIFADLQARAKDYPKLQTTF